MKNVIHALICSAVLALPGATMAADAPAESAASGTPTVEATDRGGSCGLICLFFKLTGIQSS